MSSIRDHLSDTYYEADTIEPNSRRLFSVVRLFQSNGIHYAVCRLTAKGKSDDSAVRSWLIPTGNEALEEQCFNYLQRTIISYPCYEFLVRMVDGQLAVKASDVSRKRKSTG